MAFEPLLPPHWEEDVRRYLRADLPKWDVGGFVVGTDVHTATLFAKSPGTLAGTIFANKVFEHLGLKAHWKLPDGFQIAPPDNEQGKFLVSVATVTGPVNKILLAERTALNILSRASGVATAARKAVEVARAHKWSGCVAGTRKTTPGFGLVEKYALLVAGADTHRMDLSSMVMLKDNHIWSTGSIVESVKKARRACGFSTKIEVECTSQEDAFEAAGAGADIIMLDNYSGDELRTVAAQLKEKFPHLLIEASGGITLENMPDYFSDHVDIISQGNLTNGYETLDFSLKIPKPEKFSKRARVQ